MTIRKRVVNHIKHLWAFFKIGSGYDAVLLPIRFFIFSFTKKEKPHVVRIQKFNQTANLRLRGTFDEYLHLKEIFYDECYGLVSPDNPKVIIDAGANVGMSAVYFAMRYPKAKLFAIEADPETYNYLSVNTKKFKQIITVSAALGSFTGQDVVFYKNSLKSVASSLIERPGSLPIRVPVFSFQDFCKNMFLESVDLLKCDIEGGEFQVFNNGLPSFVKTFIAEIHLDIVGRALKEARSLFPHHVTAFLRAEKKGRYIAIGESDRGLGKKIKIMYGLPSLLVGGLEKQLVSQIPFLNHHIFDITILTLFEYPGRVNLFDQVPSSVRVIRLGFKNYLDGRAWRAFFTALKEIKPNIVVSSMFSANVLFSFFQFLFSYRHIAREHNVYAEKKYWQRYLDGLIVTWAFAFVCVSDQVADFFSKKTGKEKKILRVIPNGIDREKVRAELCSLPDIPVIKKELGFDDEDRVFLHVGRQKPQKNQGIILKAFDLVATKNPSWRLAILGEGVCAKDLQKLSSTLKNKDAVHFFGHRDDVWRFYKISSLFILASSREGFPNVVLEALAAGVPVVSTRAPGVIEVVRPKLNGLLVELTIDSLARGIEEAASLFESPRNERDFFSIKKQIIKTTDPFSMQNTVNSYQSLFLEAYYS